MTLKFTHYECPLLSPLQIGQKSLESREWIEVESSGYKVDLAPLPGLHRETLEEAFEDFKAAHFKTSSALFAKEALDLKLPLGKKSQVNLLDYIDLTKTPTSYVEKWRGHRSLKLKIGRNNLKSESKWLRELMHLLPRDLKLRLDGNLQFEAEELITYLEELNLEKVEYLEEPLRNLGQWEKVYKELKVPLALDENIAKRYDTVGVTSLVVKPTFNLSLKDTIKEIEKEEFSITISSSFDPPNNLKILHALGNTTENFAGLDTLKYFNLEMLKSSPL